MEALLPEILFEKYKELKASIRARLKEFACVPETDYFYELCYCICTPQSRAKNAFEVQRILQKRDFLNNPFDPVEILREPSRYIRFHNQKADRLLHAREEFGNIMNLLKSDLPTKEKRLWFVENFNGFGMKESAHFMRNIGYRGLGILDRHILKHLVYCGVYNEPPNINSLKKYTEVESKFLEFSRQLDIDMDELDLLFWSYETGEILK